MTYKVKVENVSKVYDLNRSKVAKILSLFTMGHFYKEKPYYALRDINFEVASGDSVGIIGLNGSGKSTLSDLLGQVTVPTTGKVRINGRSSLIAINAGLNNDLTGEENIRMKCLMHGMSEETIDERYQDIVDFSELGEEFIKQPIKSYSSGMRSRLGFSIAIHTDPDVLIVDEALSVGDETFSNKCIERMKQFQQQGKTIFFVSHSAAQIKKMCNKALWVHYGEMKEYGEADPIVSEYVKFIREFKDMTKEEQLSYKSKMTKKQQEKGDQMEVSTYRRPLYRYIPAISIFALFIYSVLLQLNIF
ncbi:ABC transporter ATP-binding protein [Salinicoccus roseus]|uniref:ABC transporter ATP-binding protein n=1 Tax=Salinicoccus roseus TaxID=45670 RepID=A0A0C2DN99_9STAP|nr:ABC transporter ATP-binding protein [Salinicoccus roseus]KIH71458.1 teichoic acid ABC transporter ATP-binding protein [Salinicoccus roseus]MDB0579524.1 ABC transporter ATP-binding protein [Salinicoccus roseus]